MLHYKCRLRTHCSLLGCAGHTDLLYKLPLAAQTANMTESCAHISLLYADAGVRVMNRGPIGKSGFAATAKMVRGHAASCCRVSIRLLLVASAQAAPMALRAGLPWRLPGAHRARWGSCLRGLLPGSAGSDGHAQEVNHAARCCLHGPVISHRGVGCNGLRGAPLPAARRTAARPLADSPHPCAARAPDARGVLLGLQLRAQACGLHLFGHHARPGGSEFPQQFFLFMCRELLPALMENCSTLLRIEDEPGSTLASEDHPATGLVLVVRLGPVRPCRGPYASTEPWPNKGAGAPH
jgi:hypothetical protein